MRIYPSREYIPRSLVDLPYMHPVSLYPPQNFKELENPAQSPQNSKNLKRTLAQSHSRSRSISSSSTFELCLLHQKLETEAFNTKPLNFTSHPLSQSKRQKSSTPMEERPETELISIPATPRYSTPEILTSSGQRSPRPHSKEAGKSSTEISQSDLPIDVKDGNGDLPIDAMGICPSIGIKIELVVEHAHRSNQEGLLIEMLKYSSSGDLGSAWKRLVYGTQAEAAIAIGFDDFIVDTLREVNLLAVATADNGIKILANAAGLRSEPPPFEASKSSAEPTTFKARICDRYEDVRDGNQKDDDLDGGFGQGRKEAKR
ncbi:hypothetical protein LXL04_016215 [Taraxacum kok-saghyz]